MTDPRYHSSVTDPDETSPISADRLAELRDSVDRDREASGRDGPGASRDTSAARAERPGPDRGGEHTPRADRSAGGSSALGGSAVPGSDRPGPISRGGSPVAPVPPAAAPAGSGSGWYDQQRYTARPGDTPHSASNGQNGYSGGGYSGGGYSASGGSAGSGRDAADGRPAGSVPGSSRSPSTRPAGPPSSPTAADPRGRSAPPESPYGAASGGYGGATGYATGGTPAAGPPSTASSPYVPGSGYSSSGYGNEATSYAATGYSGSGGYGPSSYAGSGGVARDLSGTGTGMTVGGAAGAVGSGPFVGGSTLGTSPSRSRQPRGGGATGRPARRARLMVKQIDPWSTFKFSLVLAIAMFFVWLVAIGVLYGVLDGIGVFKKINDLSSELSGTNGQQLITPGLVLGLAALVGAVNIVLTTALATIGAFVYNICSDLVGGIEVTLAERD
ncbi:MAG: hypothetical protein V7637_5055 [Mycobacteriales bacterium]|jgi:hypothetical protein